MSTLTRRALVLGPLIALTPLSIDLYLPALPQIAEALDVPTNSIQLSLIAYMLAMIAGPLLWGPLSDRIGRRPAITAGLLIYTVCSIGLTFVGSFEWLIVLRFLQGFGGSSTQVCARASVRDNYSGIEAARLLSLMMLILGVAPILAPVVGAALLAVLPWRFIFAVLSVCGLLALVIVRIPFGESLPADRRQRGPIRSFFAPMARLFVNWRFMPLVLVGAFAHAGFFTYLVNSPAVLMEGYGLSPIAFGMTFGLNAFAMILGTQVNMRVLPRFGPFAIVLTAISTYAIAAILLVLAAALLPSNLLAVQIPLFVCISCLGFINANTTALSLDGQSQQAGSASAVIALSQIGLGVLGSATATVFGGGSPLVMALTMAVCALSGTVICWMIARTSGMPALDQRIR